MSSMFSRLKSRSLAFQMISIVIGVLLFPIVLIVCGFFTAKFNYLILGLILASILSGAFTFVIYRWCKSAWMLPAGFLTITLFWLYQYINSYAIGFGESIAILFGYYLMAGVTFFHLIYAALFRNYEKPMPSPKDGDPHKLLYGVFNALGIFSVVIVLFWFFSPIDFDPTKRNMGKIYSACMEWRETRGKGTEFPPSLETLYKDGFIKDSSVFLIAGSNRKIIPGKFTCDYYYFFEGLRSTEVSAEQLEQLEDDRVPLFTGWAKDREAITLFGGKKYYCTMDRDASKLMSMRQSRAWDARY